MEKYMMGVDLGTSAIKIILVDTKGNVISKSNQEYTLNTPSPLEVELNVDIYWQAFKDAVGEVVSLSCINPEHITTMGFSVQGETLVFLGKNGKPLRNAIVWMDNRAQKQAQELSDKFKDVDIYKISGQPEITSTWPASKILWFKQNQRNLFDETAYFLLLEDYFIYRLCGELVAEGSLLSSTLYWDIRTKKYWQEMLNYLGITENQLPRVCESGEQVGVLKSPVAEELGLSTNMLICSGALDQAAGSIGVGNIKPGVFSECTGSALAVVATVDGPFKDPSGKMPCHYHGIPNMYMAHTFTTGGMVFKWFRDKFGGMEIAWQGLVGQNAYESLLLQASEAPPGADGLIALPHLQGALSPENDLKAKGVFYGVTLAHNKGHFIRAILESIVFIIKRNVEVLHEMGISVSNVRSIGGGAKSNLWMQMKADILEIPTVTMKNDEAACLGAAVIAGVSTGLFSSLDEAVTEIVQEDMCFEPNPNHKQIYENSYRKYIKLYESLKEMFAEE